MKETYSISNTKSMSEDIRQLAQAFAKAKKEFVATGKSARNSHQNYKYAKIDDIYNAVEDALMNHDIIIWHYSSILDGKEMLVTRLVHCISGQFIEDVRFLESEKPGNQAKGAANTYMKKYALLSLCAISTEDDDGQSEEHYIAKRAAEPVITTEQINNLKELIKAANNKNVLYGNILKFNKITDLSELKASSYNAVTNYILSNKEA